MNRERDMSDAPEQLWVCLPEDGIRNDGTIYGHATEPFEEDADEPCVCVEYTRADLSPQWQPIETAPRDGQSILTYPHFAVTHWSNNVGSETGEGWAGRWVHELDYYMPRRPKFWMPLPKPPTE